MSKLYGNGGGKRRSGRIEPVGTRRSLRRHHSDSAGHSELRPSRDTPISAASAAGSIDSVQQSGPSGVQRGSTSSVRRTRETIQDMDIRQSGRRQPLIHLPVQGWQQQQQQQQQQPPGVTLFLINEDVEEKMRFVIRPESKLTVSSVSSPLLQDEICSTLSCLRKGLAAYEKIKTNGKEIDYLEAYCCKLPKQRRFILFKKIIVVDPAHEDNDDDYRGPSGTLELIRLYVRCFAVLGDFIFDYNLTLSFPTDAAPPNVLVVDKVWCYDDDKCAYKPKYIVLKDDYYTNCVMHRLRDIFKCKSVRFISTAHTGMFTNSNVLHDVNRSEQNAAATAVTTDTVVIASTSANASSPRELRSTSHRPLKKRKEVLLQSCIRQQQQPETLPAAVKKTKKSVTFADEHRLSQQAQPQPSLLSATPSASVANPTLIIFRPNVISVEHQLQCVICLEVHLSDRIKLN